MGYLDKLDKSVKRSYAPLEDLEQATVCDWCAFNANKYKDLDMIYAIPNGGSRNKIEAAKLKRTGVKAGVPDLFLPVPMHGKHGLYLEMKRREGGRVSDFQKTWLEKLSKNGYSTAVCHGSDEAIETIEKYYKGELDNE